MSIKIWCAYRTRKRMKRSELHALLQSLQKRARDEFERKVDEILTELTPNCDAERIREMSRFMTERYKENVCSARRSPYDFDVKARVFFGTDGRLYLIPYADGKIRSVWAFLETMEEFEDYHYQNQTDRPKSISRQAWNRRYKTWDKYILCKEAYTLNLEINTIQTWIDPYFCRQWNEMEKKSEAAKKMKEKESK